MENLTELEMAHVQGFWRVNQWSLNLKMEFSKFKHRWRWIGPITSIPACLFCDNANSGKYDALVCIFQQLQHFPWEYEITKSRGLVPKSPQSVFKSEHLIHLKPKP